MTEKTAIEQLEWIKTRSWNVDFMDTNDLRRMLETAIYKLKQEQGEEAPLFAVGELVEMNKQELIDKLEGLKFDCPESASSRNHCYNEAINASISLAKQLDEPKKVVVPRSVAEMIEIYKGKEISLAYLMRYFKGWHNKVNKGTMDSEALAWIVNNLEEFLDAWIHGYEVEKEQLYYVSFGFDRFLIKGDCKTTTGEDFIWIEVWECIENEGFEELVKFTEQEIKAIDERYWPFAVKVGNE